MYFFSGENLPFFEKKFANFLKLFFFNSIFLRKIVKKEEEKFLKIQQNFSQLLTR
jgi:hypothetical protein